VQNGQPVGKGALSKESEKVTSISVINKDIEVELNIGFFAPNDKFDQAFR
jgi:hypothetical protein